MLAGGVPGELSILSNTLRQVLSMPGSIQYSTRTYHHKASLLGNEPELGRALQIRAVQLVSSFSVSTLVFPLVGGLYPSVLAHACMRLTGLYLPHGQGRSLRSWEASPWAVMSRPFGTKQTRRSVALRGFCSLSPTRDFVCMCTD